MENGVVVEHEMCGNCKKEIPQHNYVMHTAHCARNITLCPVCKEPVPKAQFDKHREKHRTHCKAQEKMDFPKQITTVKSSNSFLTNERTNSRLLGNSTSSVSSNFSSEQNLESNSYQSSIRSEKIDRPFTLRDPPPPKSKPKQEKSTHEANASAIPKQNSLLPCKYCDLELPKLELEGHENYCGARTDKCNDCGELVMFKYKKLHEETNHGFLKLKDEPGPRPSWDSTTQRQPQQQSQRREEDDEPSYYRRQRPEPIYTLDSFDFSPLYNSYSSSSVNSDNEKRESYKDISRRLDCKTEYIRNLLHDSASITAPLRRSGTAPRNHFNHHKGQAPQPPRRRPNPPSELTIPCEFCHTPIPHEDLIQHETGCRPDLARFNPRRRSPSPDDYFTAPEPSSPEVELPCEFCADMIPASQLLRHQLTCN